MGLSKAKQLAARRKGYFKWADLLVRSGMKNAFAAQKLLNLRVLVARLTDLEEFEFELLIEWNLPEKFFESLQEIVDRAKSEAALREALLQAVESDSQFTVNDCLKAATFIANAHNINVWRYLENMNQAFLLLRCAVRYSPAGTDFMRELQINIKKDVWNDTGNFAKWEKFKVTCDADENYSLQTIDTWRQCYHEFVKQVYLLNNFVRSAHEYVEIPRQLLDDGFLEVKD